MKLCIFLLILKHFLQNDNLYGLLMGHKKIRNLTYVEDTHNLYFSSNLTCFMHFVCVCF